MSQKDKIVLVFLDAIQGVNYHRLQIPFLRLMSQGMRVHFFTDFDDIKEFNMEVVSHIVVSRRCTVTNYKAFKEWLTANDVKLVLDNDDYWDLPKHNPAYETYRDVISKEIIGTIKIADVIWTPSRYLGKRMSTINPKADVHIVHNTLDLDQEQWQQRKKPSKEVRFGYLGALGHSRDVKEICYSFAGKQLYASDLGGYPEILGASHALSPLPVDQYGKLYEYFDVSLVPLQGGTFNKCKSDLKIVEAGYTRTSVICSNVTPYREVIEDGVTGLLCSTPRDWKNAVESITKEKHRELAGNLGKFVKKNYDLDAINKIRTDSLCL
jgi:glycosyltransferase involved in cell wall biosynthesis